ncbi:MAG: Uma2 family endonuclease [Thermoguttaceae bacterium]|jgi:Uma2 family endonuclease|nr:Uma2 family endonuclease [Thermoguttaceae bacterium]
MATLITDATLEERLRDERRAAGTDHHDEVWDGVYVMSPSPTNEHQMIVADLLMALGEAIRRPGLGVVLPGVNLAGFQGDWEQDYRVPDVAVFLQNTAAANCGTHWRGAADFLIEVISPGDLTREKIPFYSRIGVRELLMIERQPWGLELYRHQEGSLVRVGESSLASGGVLPSRVLPLEFELVPAEPRPQIRVVHPESGRAWLA